MAIVTQPIVLHERLTPSLLCCATLAFAVAGSVCRKVFKFAEKQI